MTVITWGGLVAALGFALAGLSVQHLSAMSVHSNRQEAQYLARSVVSKAIERLLSDPTFCKTPPSGQILQVGTRPGAVGLLSFHPPTAGDQQIAYSVNNLEGTQPVPGALNRPVAAAQAQLIGEGRCGGAVRKVVAVLAVPPFPYAIASAGPVNAQGGLTIGALEAPPTEELAVDAPLSPANLISNFAGSQAIFLGAHTRVSGDVKAAGSVDLDPNAPEGSILVEGAIEPGSAPEVLPKIPLGDYDPLASAKPYTPLNSASYTDPLSVAGIMRRQGGLRADHGLTLDSGLLYVDGDLEIHGGLTGQGVVVCTGKVTLDGQSHLVSGNGVALLAGKDLSITGQNSEESYFQGLVYTEGTFQATRISLVGTLIAAGRNEEAVTLRESRVLQLPERSVSVTLTSASTVAQTPGTMETQANTYILPGGGRLHLTGSISGTSVTVKGDISGRNPFSFPMTMGGNINELATQIQTKVTAITGRRMASGGLNFDLPRQILTIYNGNSNNGPDPVPQTTPSVVTINPSSFLRIQDRVRVVLWKEEEI